MSETFFQICLLRNNTIMKSVKTTIIISVRTEMENLDL